MSSKRTRLPVAPRQVSGAGSLDWVLLEAAKEVEMATDMISNSPAERPERRATNRYELTLPVIIQTAGQPSRSARSKDVSTGGIYLVLESDDSLLPGAELYLTVTLAKEVAGEDEVLLRAHGKAIRVDRLGEGGTGSSMGVAVVLKTHDFTRSTSPRH
jgi:hypothetical protein